jgi:alginate O-acetyltransferase complex protein AlgI
MVFSNLFFLFVFLPIVLVLYFVLKREWRNYWLLLVSLFFYAWGEPKYVVLMMLSIMLNYVFGLLVEKYTGQRKLKLFLLWMAIVGNLGILGFYKYANFFVNQFNIIFRTDFEIESIPLPIGISFYTFQALSYVVDVYRKDAKVQRNFFDLALYVSLFPQLVAGPIVRYNTVAEEIKTRIITRDGFAEGVKRFILGLAKKVILANPLGQIADGIFTGNPGDMSVTTVWVGIIAYTLQIYFDFSGYSDMAIGLGKMFGFNFLENFNYPYISRSITEFWRRWHISLSSWFRDYVYIPLGGNRVSKVKFYRNLLIVWTITGFWHGASLTFLSWGLYYGVIISLERLGLGKVLEKTWRPIQHLYVILIVMIGWVFFRADSFSYSFSYIKVMFGLSTNQWFDGSDYIRLHDNWIILLLAVILSLPVFPFIKKKIETIRMEPGFVALSSELALTGYYFLLLLVVTILLVNSTYNPFIYFRF